nr:hypothetical protein pA40H2_p57 [Arthrobacter sp.]
MSDPAGNPPFKDEELTALEKFLGPLITDHGKILLLASWSQIDLGWLQQEGDAFQRWHDVVRLAQSHGVLGKLVGQLCDYLQTHTDYAQFLRLVEPALSRGTIDSQLALAVAVGDIDRMTRLIRDVEGLDLALDELRQLRRATLSVLDVLDGALYWPRMLPAVTPKTAEVAREELVTKAYDLLAAADHVLTVARVAVDARTPLLTAGGGADVAGATARSAAMADGKTPLLLRARALQAAIASHVVR